MKYLPVMALSLLIVGCGSQPTKQESAEVPAAKDVNIDKSLGALCGQDLQVGMMSARMRDSGKDREFLQQAVDAIPESQSRKKRIMDSSLEDAYSNPDMSPEIYAMYRMEACYQQMSGKNIPEYLNGDMVNYLIQCDEIADQDSKYKCVSAISKNAAK